MRERIAQGVEVVAQEARTRAASFEAKQDDAKRESWENDALAAESLVATIRAMPVSGAPPLAPSRSATPGSSDECPGPGRCHGSLSHCDTCGSVSLLCDMQGECDLHRERWTDYVLERAPVATLAREEGLDVGRREARLEAQAALECAEKRLREAQSKAARDDEALFNTAMNSATAERWRAAEQRLSHRNELLTAYEANRSAGTPERPSVSGLQAAVRYVLYGGPVVRLPTPPATAD